MLCDVNVPYMKTRARGASASAQHAKGFRVRIKLVDAIEKVAQDSARLFEWRPRDHLRTSDSHAAIGHLEGRRIDQPAVKTLLQ